jgi:nitroreductase
MTPIKIPQHILERRSVRAYTDEELSREDIETLIEAACLAPSAGNLQPWEFIAVTDPEIKMRLAEAALGQYFIAQAPVVIVVCAVPSRSAMRYGRRGSELYCLQDTAAAVQNILLTAVANGLGTCWVGAFNERRVAEVVKVPRGVRPIALIPVGHPAERPPKRPRRRLSEVLHWERW